MGSLSTTGRLPSLACGVSLKLARDRGLSRALIHVWAVAPSACMQTGTQSSMQFLASLVAKRAGETMARSTRTASSDFLISCHFLLHAFFFFSLSRSFLSVPWNQRRNWRGFSCRDGLCNYIDSVWDAAVYISVLSNMHGVSVVRRIFYIVKILYVLYLNHIYIS